MEATVFLGEYRHNLDAKGRLATPYRMRRALEEGAVVTRSVDGCLTVYTQTEWEKLAQQIANLPLSNQKARRFARFFLAGAAQISFDKQGRALVPQYLRDFAELSDEVVVAGVFNRIELWAASKWDAQATTVDPEADLEGLEI